MFEWLSEQYLKLIANYKILFDNPTQCSTVDILRLFTFTLIAIFLIKLLFHLVMFYRLKRRYPEYLEETHPQLFDLYRNAARKIKLRRLPRLYQFSNENPLVFTIGSLRPAIFLAPQLVEKLPQEELEAALVHELTHIKRHDNLLVWFSEILFISIPALIIQVFAISFVFSIENSVYALLGALTAPVIFKAFLWRRVLFLRELSCDDLSVDAIKDPLILASSLINVWRIGKELPKHSWQAGLAFTQSFIPTLSSLENRVQRLIEYRRPWFKFFLSKAVRVTAFVLVIFIATFLWQFYSNNSHLHWSVGHGKGFHFCSDQCEDSWRGDSSIAFAQGLAPDRFVMIVDDFVESYNAKDFLRYNEEDYIEMQGEFGDGMLKKYPLELIKASYNYLFSQYGEIQNIDSPQFTPPNGAIFTLHFERGMMDLYVELDEQEKITAFYFLNSNVCQIQLSEN